MNPAHLSAKIGASRQPALPFLAPGWPSMEENFPLRTHSASPRLLTRTTGSENEDETKPFSRLGGLLAHSLPQTFTLSKHGAKLQHASGLSYELCLWLVFAHVVITCEIYSTSSTQPVELNSCTDLFTVQHERVTASPAKCYCLEYVFLSILRKSRN